MIKLDGDLAALKRAVAHLELGLKAYKTAVLSQTDADRLLAACRDQLTQISSVADAAIAKIAEDLDVKSA